MYGPAPHARRRVLLALLALAAHGCRTPGAAVTAPSGAVTAPSGAVTAPSGAVTAPAPSAQHAPKYPPTTLPLSREHSYLQRAPAPDFWTLLPYYTAQRDDVSCSLASLSMLVNAARHATPLASEEPLVTQQILFQRVQSQVWRHGLQPSGPGVTLQQLATLAEQSLRAFGLTARVHVHHVPQASLQALAELREVLSANETSARDWLLLNFLAQRYVGVGDYGHIAPVAAYDEAQRRVLVLDPDREWYEPYWISDEVALTGMATLDLDSALPRGYVHVTLCDGACPP